MLHKLKELHTRVVSYREKGKELQTKAESTENKKRKLETKKEKITIFYGCNIELTVIVGAVLLCKLCHHTSQHKAVKLLPDCMVSHSQTTVHFIGLEIVEASQL
jgi:hypothetical protein